MNLIKLEQEANRIILENVIKEAKRQNNIDDSKAAMVALFIIFFVVIVMGCSIVAMIVMGVGVIEGISLFIIEIAVLMLSLSIWTNE